MNRDEITFTDTTLRDQYAGCALIGRMASFTGNVNPDPVITARMCFAMAEAMVAEKARRDAK